MSAAKKLFQNIDLDVLPEGIIGEIQVDPSTLQRLGWSRAVVGRKAVSAHLEEMVCMESVGRLHTWSQFAMRRSASVVEQLIEFENKKRPTEIFFYYGVPEDGGMAVLFGVAAVSAKLSHNFSHTGYPVIARCLIAPQFRNVRLYSALLRHRFDYCIERWGKDLKGIHLGTGNPAVYHAVNAFGFSYFGIEHLGTTEDSVTIHDYLWMTSDLKAQWTAPPNDPRIAASPQWDELARHLRKLLENRFDQSDYLTLTNLMLKLKEKFGWTLTERAGVAQTIELMEAIPLLKTTEKGTPAFLLAPDQRRKAS